jgi:aldose sugar dehydrogenase
MKTPIVLVTVALTLAILLAASFLIATGTRGEDAPGPLADHPAGQIQSPAAK